MDAFWKYSFVCVNLAHGQRPDSAFIRNANLCCFHFCSHATEVMDTADWKRLVQSHSNIVADAFRALASLKASPPIWGPPKKKQKPG